MYACVWYSQQGLESSETIDLQCPRLSIPVTPPVECAACSDTHTRACVIFHKALEACTNECTSISGVSIGTDAHAAVGD